MPFAQPESAGIACADCPYANIYRSLYRLKLNAIDAVKHAFEFIVRTAARLRERGAEFETIATTMECIRASCHGTAGSCIVNSQVDHRHVRNKSKHDLRSTIDEPGVQAMRRLLSNSHHCEIHFHSLDPIIPR